MIYFESDRDRDLNGNGVDDAVDYGYTNDSGWSDVFVMNADGSGQRNLTRTPRDDYNAVPGP